MVTIEDKKKLGRYLLEFLNGGLRDLVSLEQVREALEGGNIDGAKEALRETLQDPRNLYGQNPEVVAERLVGSPLLYFGGLSEVVSGVITSAVALRNPGKNRPDLFEAEPGTLGFFYRTQRGGYGSLLVAAHEKGKLGVVGIEGVTVGSERLTKTEVLRRFRIMEGAGVAIPSWERNFAFHPRFGHLPQGYSVQKNTEDIRTVYTLRKV